MATELDPQILAHRGASGWYPEGTELALRKALTVERDEDGIKGGADILEIDLRVSRDKHLFLHHNETFLQTAGVDAAVSDLDSEAIKKLDAGAVFKDPRGRGFANNGLRFLEIQDAFQMFPGRRFNIEMKEGWHEDSLNRLLKAILDAKLEDKVVLASQKKANLRFFRERHFPTSASKWELVYALAAATLGFGLAKPDYQLVQAWYPRVLPPRRIVTSLRTWGVNTHFWTVNDRDKIRKAVDSGAAGIITNFPGKVYEELVSRGRRPPPP